MKNPQILSLLALSFCGPIFSGCGDDELKNPGYPAEPSIRFESIKFKEVGGVSDYDTLKFTISYKDGDSDLGLSNLDPEDYKFPYHEDYFFIESGTGDTARVIPEIKGNYKAVRTPPGSGLLVTSKTRNKPGYNYLPEFNPLTCADYLFNTVIVSKHSVDENFNIQDTISIDGEDYIKITENFLWKLNENHNNIFVEFFVFNNGSFEPYDFFEEFCITYDGRIPLIADKRSGRIKGGPFTVNIKTPWEGKITYNMANSSWLQIFGDKTMKLKITIKDRALHTSNSIITPEFTLNGIK